MKSEIINYFKFNLLKVLGKCGLSKDASLIALFFFTASILVFAPAIYRPSIFQIYGGDVYHNLWIWGRNVSNVMAGVAPYSPNIFFPDPMSSFYSEMEVGDSLLYALFSAFGLHPIISYLVIVILAFALTGIMVALIARRLGASTTAAILGGTIAAFASYRYSQLAHIQLLATYWMLIPLFFSLSYLLDGKRRDLILTGIAHIPIFCGVSYNLIGLFLLESGIFLAFICNGMLDIHLRWRRAKSLVLVVTSALAVTIPFWLGYLDLFKKGFERAHSSLMAYHVDLLDLLIPSGSSLMYSHAAKAAITTDLVRESQPLFVGFVALILIIMTIFYRQTKCPAVKKKSNCCSRYLFSLKWLAIVMLALSLGETVSWRNMYVLPNPIFAIGEVTHLLSATRYITHYAYFSLVAFSIVVACRLRLWPENLGKSTRSRLHIGLAILVILENFVVYEPNSSALPAHLAETPHVYFELAKLPAGKGVVFVPTPLAVSNQDVAFYRQFEYMRYAQYHRLKMFNGNTGFFPSNYTQGLGLLAEFPNLPGLNFLLRNKIEYVVNDKHSGRMMDFSNDKMALLCGALSSIYSDTDYDVFHIDHARAKQCISKAGDSALMQWVFPLSSATPHQTGEFNSSVNAMVSKLGDQGALVFGPYIMLEKGKYQATFLLEAAATVKNGVVGTVDVNGYSDKVPSSVYKKVSIYAGVGGKQNLQIDFEVLDPKLKHEFRVRSNGTGTIKVFKISLVKKRFSAHQN